MKHIWIQCLLLLILPFSGVAQTDPVTIAKRAAAQLDSAAVQLKEAETSSDRAAALTSTIRAYEEGLSAFREGLRRIAIRERAISLAFEAQEDRLSRLLGVLQTIGKSPAPLSIMHPSGALGTARSGMIVSDVAPALHKEASILKAQLEEVAELRALQEAAESQLTVALERLQTARAALSKAVADRIELPGRISEDAGKMADLVASADTLQGFADSLTTLGGATLSQSDIATAKGTLPLPVRGSVIRGYKEQGADGLTRPGITVATTSGAIVTAPWPSTIRYAGPLLNYGDVVILEPGPGTMVILAGLDQPLVRTGQVVSTGDALGFMGGTEPQAHSFLISAAKGGGGNREESLYIEVREGNAPTNPADWFAVDKG